LRKEQVNAAADKALLQTEKNATIDKAKIDANYRAAQAQLNADKKIIDAEADAAKAKVDAEIK
jgi:hypothetical protein